MPLWGDCERVRTAKCRVLLVTRVFYLSVQGNRRTLTVITVLPHEEALLLQQGVRSNDSLDWASPRLAAWPSGGAPDEVQR